MTSQQQNNRRKEVELAALCKAIQTLNSSLNLTETLNSVMNSLIQLTEAERGCLMLRNDDGNLETRATGHSNRADENDMDMQLSHTVVQKTIETKQPILTTNAQLDSRFDKQASVVGYRLRSIVCVPLCVRDKVIGALYLDNRLKDGAFSESDIPTLIAFANQAAAAIENAHLFEAAHKERELNEALGRASAIVNSTLNIDEVLDHILEQVERVVPGDTFNIMLIEKQIAKIVRWRGNEGNQPPENTRDIPIARYPNFEKMVTTKKPVVVPNTAMDPNWVSENEEEWRFSYVAAPICIADQVVGFLNVNGYRPKQFDAADAKRLMIFAHHAATALENANLYQRLHQHADDLTRAVAKLKELDQLKNQFIQNVSHELRTPLAIIHGYATLLDDGELGELQPEQKTPVKTIRRHTKALTETVEDITLIHSLETVPLNRQPVRLDKLIHKAVRPFEEMAKKNQITLSLEAPSRLPPIEGCPDHLQHVINNLLSNAFKFTSAGGSVTIKLEQRDNYVLIHTTDTGIGIPPEQRTRIFERFYQVDGSTRRRYGGMGLGLALVKEATEAHGGTVAVESEVGKGSTFTVALPIASQADMK